MPAVPPGVVDAAERRVRDHLAGQRPRQRPQHERQPDEGRQGARADRRRPVDAAAEVHQPDQQRDDPHPVLVPGQRGDQQSRQRAREDAGDLVARPPGRHRERQATGRDDRRDDVPRGMPRPRAEQPDQHAVQGLVVDRRDAVRARGPVGVGEDAVEPELAGVPPVRGEAQRGERDERAARRDRGAHPSGQQQVDGEQRGHQLDRGGHADPDPGGPTAPAGHCEVEHHEQHQHDVDLALAERVEDRLQPEDGGRRRACRAEQAEPPPVAEHPEGEPSHQAERDHVDGDGDFEHGCGWQQRHRGKCQNRHWRVGERPALQILLIHPEPVPVRIAAKQENRQIEPAERDHPGGQQERGQGSRERDNAWSEQPARQDDGRQHDDPFRCRLLLIAATGYVTGRICAPSKCARFWPDG